MKRKWTKRIIILNLGINTAPLVLFLMGKTPSVYNLVLSAIAAAGLVWAVWYDYQPPKPRIVWRSVTYFRPVAIYEEPSLSPLWAVPAHNKIRIYDWKWLAYLCKPRDKMVTIGRVRYSRETEISNLLENG